MQISHTLSRNVLAVTCGVLLLSLIVTGSLLLKQTQFSHATQKVPAKVSAFASSDFERGIVYPRWHKNAYGTVDETWQTGIKDIRTQTAARWLEMPILFSQKGNNATTVELSPSTPTVEAFTEGIRSAHAHGYKIFFVPLMSVHEAAAWSGTINLPTTAKQQAWFDSYWAILKPYVEAASANGVEQIAIGTELQNIQRQVPASFWNQLITRFRTTYQGKLTYDMNWSSLEFTLPTWLKNSELSYIGVSSYIPLTETNIHIPTQQISTLWKQKVLSKLDQLSEQVGKQVLISEIGYRNTSDALYHTWVARSSAPVDTALQAAAFEAVFTNVRSDTHIAGTFFWGWDDVGMFKIKGQPAVKTLQKWYALA